MITRYKADAPRQGEKLAVAAIMVTDVDGDWVDYEDHVLELMAQDKLLAARGATIAAQDKRIAELEADRRVLQSSGEHPAPCARHCEANAFQIELRNKDAHIKQLLEVLDTRGTRIAELEAEVSSWRKCCREGQEMLNTIGRQLGGKIPEQLVSEVARQCMDRIDELEAVIAALRRAHKTWSDKTDWVQDQNFGVIGDHRADAINAHIERQDARIDELEKQAAIDKTLLALADARINRELRDDFAGRAMQGMITAGRVGPSVSKEAYIYSDDMLKAKGGA